MMHQEFAVPNILQDAVKCFWYNDRDFGPQQASFEVVPDGYAEIIFHFGNGCSIEQNGITQDLPSPFMVGLLNHPITFHTRGRLQIVAVRCFPWTVFDLLQLTSGDGAVNTFKNPVAALHPVLSRLIAAKKLDEAITQLSAYFVSMRAGVSIDSMLHKAGVAMAEANGAMQVKHIASAAHATVRTLERNFKRSSGHNVKDVSALIRFEKVRNALWSNPAVNIAGLAHELGYADQSHLTKEFKRFSGTTPRAFAKRALGKEMASSAFVAFVQS